MLRINDTMPWSKMYFKGKIAQQDLKSKSKNLKNFRNTIGTNTTYF